MQLNINNIFKVKPLLVNYGATIANDDRVNPTFIHTLQVQMFLGTVSVKKRWYRYFRTLLSRVIYTV